MKKYLVSFIAILFTLTAFSQAQGWLDSRASEYASLAQKEYKLDAQQVEQIKSLWIERRQAFADAGEKLKSGKISESERKKLNGKVAKKYTGLMCDVLDIEPAEFRVFNKAAAEAMRK